MSISIRVSEKTVYNYFPTKESMVLDLADEGLARLVRALRERGPAESVTAAVVRALKEDMGRFAAVPEELQDYFPMFGRMISSTPSLRAAWLELHDRLASVAAEELAAQAEVDPRAPEPVIAGRALAGLALVTFNARVRYIEEGLRGPALERAVRSDLDRAARLLETGLWSLNLRVHGRRTREQLLDAAVAAEDARQQVVKTLRQARAGWRALRHEH